VSGNKKENTVINPIMKTSPRVIYFLKFLKCRIKPADIISTPLIITKKAILSSVMKIVDAPISKIKKIKVIFFKGELRYFKKNPKYKIKNRYLARKIPGIGLSLNGPVSLSGLKEYFGLPKKS